MARSRELGLLEDDAPANRRDAVLRARELELILRTARVTRGRVMTRTQPAGTLAE